MLSPAKTLAEQLDEFVGPQVELLQGMLSPEKTSEAAQLTLVISEASRAPASC